MIGRFRCCWRSLGVCSFDGAELCRGVNLLLVDSLHKLPNDEGHTLDTLDLLLSSDELTLQTPVAACQQTGELW